jgi:hypothetical protein
VEQDYRLPFVTPVAPFPSPIAVMKLETVQVNVPVNRLFRQYQVPLFPRSAIMPLFGWYAPPQREFD